MKVKAEACRLPDEILATERQAFEQQRMQLALKHKREYVAFCGSKMVDADKNDEVLAERMFEKFGDQPFYIGRVPEDPAVYEVPSPEVVG